MLSKNISYIPRLDHLRFLAAGMIFAFHLFHDFFGHWQPHPQLAWFGLITEGHTGIALFFVLSGFMFMTIAYQGGDIKYRQFMHNRFLRIFPLFLFIYFLSISVGRDQFRAADIFYIFFSNLGTSPTSSTFITGAAWTISLEFTFYMVFPFLAKFTRNQGPGYLIRMIFIMLVVKAAAFGVSQRPTHMFYSTLVGRFDQFLWGMLAAWLFYHKSDLLKRLGNVMLPAGLCLVIFAVYFQARYASYFSAIDMKSRPWIYWGTCEALMWGFVLLSYLTCTIKIPGIIDKILTFGGRLSYSFYLWHGMIIFLWHEIFNPLILFEKTGINFLLNTLIVFPIALGFSWISFNTIELPFLEMRKKYLFPVQLKPQTKALKK